MTLFGPKRCRESALEGLARLASSMGAQPSYEHSVSRSQHAAHEHNSIGIYLTRPATLPIATAPTRIVLGQSASISDNPIADIPDSHFRRCAQAAPKVYNWWVNPDQLHGSYNPSEDSMYISLRLPVPIDNFPVICPKAHISISYKAVFTSLQWYEYKNWTRILLISHQTTAVLISQGAAFYLRSSECLALILMLREHIYKVGARELEGTTIPDDGFHVTWTV